MTESSPRMNWPYPSENDDPWWDKFVDLIRALDASGFASREDRNLFLMGGGSVNWNAGTSVLSWTAAIEFLSPNTGFLNQVPAGNITIADGQVVLGVLARALGENASMAVSVASFAQPTDNSVVLCIRRGTQIYWRNGLIMSNGDTITNLGSTQGSGAVTLAGDVTGSSGANTVEKIRNVNVLATAPVAGNLLANDGTNWGPVAVGGDIIGPITAVEVAALRGDPIDAAIAPALNDFLKWDGAKWIAAAIATSASNFAVFQPGGVASGIVYTTWASFYAAMTAIVGPKFAIIDTNFGPAQVPLGAYTFEDWRFFGSRPGIKTTLTFMDGATWTLPMFSAKNFEMNDMAFELDAGSTTSAIKFQGGSGGNLRVVMRNSSLFGLAAHGFIDGTAIVGGQQNTVRIDAYGASLLDAYAITLDDTAPGSGSNGFMYLFDSASMNGSAVTGPSGYLEMHQENRGATIRSQPGLLLGSQVFRGQATPHDWPLDKSQLGTVELHVGSIYLYTDSILRSISRAMLGGSIPADTGILKLRRFTGGALVATWTAAGTLQDTQLGSDIIIANDDWYDLYLVAGGLAQTAVVKGVRLFVHEPGSVS